MSQQISSKIEPSDFASSDPPADHRERGVDRLRSLASLLDDRFEVPGLGVRFGLDGLIGLVPGIGDTITSALGLLIVGEAWRLGCRKRTLMKMLGNLGLDWGVGLVPLLGDLLDFGFKSNRRNVALVLEELERELGRADTKTVDVSRV
ncbi:MAG: DUF4112 domain-containing protein [Geminicoccaceae bacterium]